jgi:hypothetical protein
MPNDYFGIAGCSCRKVGPRSQESPVRRENPQGLKPECGELAADEIHGK